MLEISTNQLGLQFCDGHFLDGSITGCEGQSYGHIGADLISLASILRIPVYMHNVDRGGVFRPSA
jgi:hypothetical protein